MGCAHVPCACLPHRMAEVAEVAARVGLGGGSCEGLQRRLRQGGRLPGPGEISYLERPDRRHLIALQSSLGRGVRGGVGGGVDAGGARGCSAREREKVETSRGSRQQHEGQVWWKPKGLCCPMNVCPRVEEALHKRERRGLPQQALRERRQTETCVGVVSERLRPGQGLPRTG
jgi:hypothetical protein